MACKATVPLDAPNIPGRLKPILDVGRTALSFSGIQEVSLQFHDEEPEEACLSFDSASNGNKPVNTRSILL